MKRRRLPGTWIGYARRCAYEDAVALRLLFHAHGHLPRCAPTSLEALTADQLYQQAAVERLGRRRNLKGRQE